MDSREIDEYIKETIDHSLGLISNEVLKKKIYTVEESLRRLREENQSLVSSLKEKDKVIKLVRSEASMNAQALKKFVEENQKLGMECEDLVSQCQKWESECLLYHQDREALMDFGNESDERAREAEFRVRDLEQQVRSMKQEDSWLDSVLASFVGKDEEETIFLESNIQDQYCQTMLSKWDQLKPSTRKALALVSAVKRIEKEKECVVLNLAKAEEEVELVSIQNTELDRENRNLLKQCSSGKSNKRKSPKMITSPIEKRIDLSTP